MVGPLAQVEDPHAWDLCDVHGDKITAPLGWEMLRVDHIELDDDEDLLALAEAVREAGRVTTGLIDGDGPGSGADPIDYAPTFDGADPDSSNHPVFRTRRVADEKSRRRAHLRVVPDADSAPEEEN